MERPSSVQLLPLFLFKMLLRVSASSAGKSGSALSRSTITESPSVKTFHDGFAVLSEDGNDLRSQRRTVMKSDILCVAGIATVGFPALPANRSPVRDGVFPRSSTVTNVSKMRLNKFRCANELDRIRPPHPTMGRGTLAPPAWQRATFRRIADASPLPPA